MVEGTSSIDPVNCIRDGILVFGVDREVVYVDDQLPRMLGLGEDDSSGVLSRIQFAGSASIAEILDAAESEGTWRGEAAGLTADDHAIYLEIIAHRLGMGAHGSQGAILMIRNVTRDRLMEQRVLDAEQMELVEKLSRGIVHEFKNLLTILSAYGSLLQMRLKDHEVGPDIEKIMETATRATELTQRLSRVTRRPKPEFINSDLEEVLLEIGALIQKAMPAGVRVHVPQPQRMPMVMIDAGALVRSVVHLALNGCEAMPDGGELTLDCTTITVSESDLASHPAKRAGRYVILSVTDTGFGMTPEVKNRLFEPFYTTKETGTGLGLASVRDNIASMRGFLTVYSEPAQGTCARIYLPVVDDGQFGGTEDADETPRTAGQTILVIDDDDMTLGIASRILKLAGYTVHATQSGPEGIAIVEKLGGDIDGVLLDVVMPEMNGQEVLQQIRALRPDMPVALTSGFPQDAVDRIMGPLGVPVVAKPFTRESLVQAMRDVLAAR